MFDLTHVLEQLLAQVDSLRDGRRSVWTVALPDGTTLEARYVQTLDALCMAAPLGRLLRSTQTEVLLEMMMSNLMLASQGQPHFALNTETGEVVLCRTAPHATRDAQSLATEARVFLALWQQSRDALVGSGSMA